MNEKEIEIKTLAHWFDWSKIAKNKTPVTRKMPAMWRFFSSLDRYIFPSRIEEYQQFCDPKNALKNICSRRMIENTLIKSMIN